jgi:hypothetical protein
MFSDKVKVGQTLIRAMKGWEDSPDKLWTFEARVTNITDTHIECVVFADVPRIMEFDLNTGIHIHGDEHGWLVVT